MSGHAHDIGKEGGQLLKRSNTAMSKGLRLWIGIAVSIACLALILWQVDLERVVLAIGMADWKTLPFVIGAYILFIVLRAWRWQIMLGSEVGYWPVFHAQNIGYLLTNILPFRIGELGRAYVISRQPGLSALQALSSVALERVLDILIIVLFLIFSLPMVPVMPLIIAQAGITFAVLSAILLSTMFLLVSQRPLALTMIQRVLVRVRWLETETWLRQADLFLKGLQSLIQWRQLVGVLGLSFAVWIAATAAFYWGISAFWSEAAWPVAVFTLCATSLGLSVPSSPSSIGVFHASVWLALSVFRVPSEQALGFAFMYHALAFILVLILGGIGLWQCGQTLQELSTATRNYFAQRHRAGQPRR